MRNEAIAKTARLEARLPVEVHSMLKRAADLQGRTLSDFVITAAQNAARRAIEEAEIIRLSTADQRMLADALLNPPEPTPALRRAAKRYRQAIDGA